LYEELFLTSLLETEGCI